MLHIANTGGIPPYIRKVSGKVERPEVNGFPLGHGLGVEFGYSGVQFTLCDGDRVILVSDGVVEATDASQAMFGFDRLRRTIAEG